MLGRFSDSRKASVSGATRAPIRTRPIFSFPRSETFAILLVYYTGVSNLAPIFDTMARLRQSVYYETQYLRTLAQKKPAAFMKIAGIILHGHPIFGERVWDPDIINAEIVGGNGGVDQIKNECRCLIGWLRDAGLVKAPRKTNTGAWTQ